MNPMDNSNSTNPTSMNNSSSSMSMGMTPWLHFGNTDPVLSEAWRPSSRGAVAGACIGLILFSLLERCLAAYRRSQELRWRARPILTSSSVQSVAGKGDGSGESGVPLMSAHREVIPPFIPSHDIPRGVIQAIQSTFSYALMLVVMTYNGAYIISVILGLGIGEVLFGRIARGQKEI